MRGLHKASGRWSRRWVLWGLLCLLVSLLLSALVFLAKQYEDNRAIAQLEQNTVAMSVDIRSALLRNVQSLQALHATHTSADSWQAAATELLGQHREITGLEWRDRRLELRAQRTSPYYASLYGIMARPQALADVRQACANADRTSGPAYSASYFWPMAQGQGQEMMEMCLPLTRDGQADGYIIATYSLPGILSEMVSPETRRGRSVAITEADGTRLSILGTPGGRNGTLHAEYLLDLPGAAYMLRVDRPLEYRGWLPHVLTVAVGVLALSLLGVLALLARDIGRRLRAESQLADALAFRKAMEDSLVTGLRARDMQGRITYVNPAFCQMVGLRPDQLIGTSLPAPYWPTELVNEYQHRHSVRMAGQALPREGFESEFQRTNGTRFPVLIIEAPLINAQGEQTGWMSAILDMSEQRRVEELSRASQERLQATARLAMAGEMASMISHELNQPLAAIASYASGTLNLLEDLPQQLASNPAQQAAVCSDITTAIQRMAEQAERAGKVIRGVADLVRQRERQRAAVPPGQLFDAVMPLLRLRSRKLSIDIHTQVAPGCPDAWCDQTMIEQVLLNLARNGFQAMPPGTPPAATGLRRLDLVATVVTDPRGMVPRQWVEFAVTDRGQGLSEEVAQRLFTPFFTTKADGMGLGLNLCRTVVEQHGGALRFEPNHPVGTTFRFTLPAAVSSGAT